MKKWLKWICLVFILLLCCATIWRVAYHRAKSTDNLPALSALADADEGDTNALLMGYKQSQLISVWGEPTETVNDNELIWEIDPQRRLHVFVNNRGIVSIIALEGDE